MRGDDVTVLIRCHNEERHIGYAIQSVTEFLPSASILIIDNESEDSSMDIARSFLGRCEISINRIDKYTPGRALNMGVHLASTPFLLILSAHCELTRFDNKTLDACVTSHGAVFGKQIPIWRGKKITPRYIWSHFGDDRVQDMESSIENRPFFHNACSLFTRGALIKQPFREDIHGKEDRYWAADRLKNHGHYVYQPALECRHHYTENGATWKGLG